MPAQGVAARGEGGGAGTSAPRALIEITDRIELMRTQHLPALAALLTAATCTPAAAGDGAVGMASYYAGVGSANGGLTAAHRSLPFGTRVRVTTLGSAKSVVVRINDRGPFIAGRIIDVSRRAAVELGIISAGLARVRLEVLRGSEPQLTSGNSAARSATPPQPQLSGARAFGPAGHDRSLSRPGL
jgi:rare lipoprotein A